MKKLLSLVGLIVIAVFIVACGGGSPVEPEAEEPETVEAIEEEAVEVVEKEETADEDQDTTVEESMDDKGDGSTQMFTDDNGRTIEIPANPQKILFAGTEHAAQVTSLGYVPYAMIDSYGGEFATILEGIGGDVGDLSSVINVGNVDDEPNLEKILEIEPDLIVWWYWDPEIVDQLQQLAPTIALNPRVNGPGGYEGPGGPRYSKQRTFASLVGLEAELDAQIAEYDSLLADVKARHGDLLADLEWNFLDTGDTFDPHMYDLDRFEAWAYVAVMRDLGMAPSAAMVEATRTGFGYDENFGYAQVSLEVVGDYSADLLFVGRYDEAPIGDQLQTLLNGTPPGQANQIFRVDSNKWAYHLIQSEIGVLTDVAAILDAGVENVGDFD
ncbi:MAG: hypothetical protein AAF633_13950 [Chloroflexota bacterium]